MCVFSRLLQANVFVLVLCSLFSAFVLKWCCSCFVGGSKQKQSVVLSHQGGEVRGSPLISACGPLGKCEVDKRQVDVKRVFGENPTNLLIKHGSLLCGQRVMLISIVLPIDLSVCWLSCISGLGTFAPGRCGHT